MKEEEDVEMRIDELIERDDKKKMMKVDFEKDAH